MRNLLMARGALSLAIPTTMAFPTGKAEARKQHYSGKTSSHKKVCRKSSGTTGLVAGGVGGAFAGRAIDRTITAKKRCR
jgi:hypothetical protein